MNIGQLDRRVKHQQYSTSQTAFGDKTKSWNAGTDYWAHAIFKDGKEKYIGNELKTVTTVIFTNWITLPISPLASVTHIKYYDSDNTLQTWDASNYIVDSQSKPPRIRLSQSSTFPSTYTRPNAVEIKYVAGYTSTSAVGYPTALNAAIYLIVGHLYENRQEVVSKIQYELPQGAQTIIDNFKILTV